MNSLVFVDTEIDRKSGKVLDIGCIRDDDRRYRSSSVPGFDSFIDGVHYICGHNILKHDIPYLQRFSTVDLSKIRTIDTLYLSPLLFPARPYHALVKDDKLKTGELNNPLNDAFKAKDLFYDEVSAFHGIDYKLKRIFFTLLKDTREFSSFFRFTGYSGPPVNNILFFIHDRFKSRICRHAGLKKIVKENPIELAFCLALINTDSRYSITPPWVFKNYPDVERVMYLLRNNPCLYGCSYCIKSLDAKHGLKNFFGFDSFRTYGGKPLQEIAVEAAIKNRSILAVFPTGGGKSVTFQVPALISGESVKGLTVVISPLQSLMKDQVDNLENLNITQAVTINGLLDPIERTKSFERVENGSASILYISPESLRSRTIEHLLLGRNIVRFVIDEAHCFSSWGQDFRVDYLYIGDFIKSLQEKKNLGESIPVSCFTATAKQNVIQDIKDYFQDKLSLQLQTFNTNTMRTNLRYKVFYKETDDEKYAALRNLIDGKQCPTIIYVSRTKRADRLANRLSEDGYLAKAYHGKMDKQEKSENQDAFIRGEVPVMVATSAFGMGVDKKDIGTVIHYDISDSLENYVQEAGRAGRDEHITADCYILYNEEDLNKHFILLNQTKINIKEIQQIWKAIKELTRYRSTVSNSALEIARKAGWDDSVVEIETRVTTAISALEEAGYLKRGQNMPRIFANSILSKNAQDAIDKIKTSELFDVKQKQHGIRIIKKLFSSRSRKNATNEDAESRIDYISDHLGIVTGDVINVVNLLREEKILADTKDLTAFIRRGERKNQSLGIVRTFNGIERFLLTQLEDREKIFHVKELNEQAEQHGCDGVSPNKLKTVINFWNIKNWIKSGYRDYSRNQLTIVANHPVNELKNRLERRQVLARFIVKYLFEKSNADHEASDIHGKQRSVEFSVHELKEEYKKECSGSLFKLAVSVHDIEDTLFYLSKIEALKIDGGFLVVYNKLSIERLEQDTRKRYKTEDYTQLSRFYENKIQQIHIVGEYAGKMIRDLREALQFVEDYFQLHYTSFLNKYFNALRQNDLKRNLTPAKFRQLFGELSPAQLSIIRDQSSQYIVVAAGPGSGKTKVLVHKLASLLIMEDVKHEQLLMVTFSRAAATEFKKRLLELIGNAAAFIEIKTFHSYCFDLLGKVGSIEKSASVVRLAYEKIRTGDIDRSRISKTVLVIDEAQDMDIHEYKLLLTLMERNEDMRVIAVGDDDQNIFEFRGASSKYLERFIVERKARKYELSENFRSAHNLVEFTDRFAGKIGRRLKELPAMARRKENGVVKVIRHFSDSLIQPVVRDVLTSDLSGTTCVLTQTNDEALQVKGILIHRGLPARIIQTNDGFCLSNLLEVRYFLDQCILRDETVVISDSVWRNAKNRLENRFKKSTKIDICLNLINEFESSNPGKKYVSDFNVFIRESKLEDFVGTDGETEAETVLVSTMHKAKGKEFDNVCIMLNGYHPNTDEKKRLLYVAMTRAKNKISIHLNGNYLDDISDEGVARRVDNSTYDSDDRLFIYLTHRDIWLDYFFSNQPFISTLRSGDQLKVKDDGCVDNKGNYALKFSSQFRKKLTEYIKNGYELHNAEVNYIVYWRKEGTNLEVKIILPELELKKILF